MSWNTIWTTVTGWVMNTGLKLVIALIILVIAFKLINKLAKKLESSNLKKNTLDPTIYKALVNVGAYALKILVVICLIGYLGIETSGFAAVIASLGVAAGLAVNGALSNIAGGVLLLVTRPIKVGDFVDIGGTVGTVEAINLTATKIRTNDNIVVYVPNSTASSATISNYSEKELRRVDHTFSVSYKTDIEKAKKVIEMVLEYNEKVLKDPAWNVRLMAHGENGLQITCRAWVESVNYWDVYFDLLEQVKIAFDENNIEIPYGQLDVHIKSEETSSED